MHFIQAKNISLDSVANDRGPRAEILKYNVNVEPNLSPRLFATLSNDLFGLCNTSTTSKASKAKWLHFELLAKLLVLCPIL